MKTTRKTTTGASTPLTAAELAARIDHTLLRTDITEAALVQLCAEAVEYGFATVCVHGCFAAQAAELLAHQAVRVCTVVGFPLGCCHSRVKLAEAAQALEDGAGELDMVINLPAARAGQRTYLAREVEAILKLCRQEPEPATLKVILETAALETHTKIALCRLMSNLGVDFIKTSTGLHPAGGATLEDVRLLYAYRGSCRVKAAGGIRNLATCRAMIDAGAARIGTSHAVAILKELQNRA